VVLDTSVVAGWVLADEPWHEASLGLARDIATGALEAQVAPNLRFELNSVLVKAARRGRVTWPGLAEHLAAVDRFGLVVSCLPIADADLVATCRAYGISWADAHHALLAAGQGLPLITADQRLVSALRTSPVWVESILDRPMV
jgi:predicted nucleic acid-binding protein